MKAVFCDFYGTVVHQNGRLAYEVIGRIYKSSNAPDPEAVVAYWRKVFAERLYAAFGKNYRTQYEAALDSFADVIKFYGSSEDPGELCDLMVQDWCNPVVYDETRQFMDQLEWPVYFVTNSDNLFITKAVENLGLDPTGVITSEQARCAKPRKEIFLYALENNGLEPKDTVHIGDSLEGDVYGAAAAGLKTIWLNRDAKAVPEGVTSAASLKEAGELLYKI